MFKIKRKKLRPRKVIGIITLVSFIITTTFTFDVRADNDKVIYPFKEVSKLNCRLEDFSSLSKDCKQKLPILNTKDYKKYIKKDGGYNEYTRYYTVLWGSSYKYGWDVGNGGHEGIDIATAKGTPVYSIADGVVIIAKKDPSWGNVVSVKHKIRGKEIISNYAHLSKLSVKKGQAIKVGTKIGEVGSTGNSTGNHLHFQIDLPYLFHPFYYSWKTCPYNYYKITEEGLCFDELSEHTIDPLKFLETQGSILDEIKIVKTKLKVDTKTSKTVKDKDSKTKNIKTNTLKGFDMTIFNKTVHTELNSSSKDVKAVQTIYKDLGYYKGKIDGKYSNVESAIIDYQVDKNVIANRNSTGAGWFGPKTRAHTKSSYIKYLSQSEADKIGNKKVYIGKTNNERSKVKQKVEKLERKNILTREEIEKREIDEFLKNNEVNFRTDNVGGNITLGDVFNINLEVLKKKNSIKRAPYKGTIPAGMTFEVDNSLISTFPTKITYISNGKRDIKLEGLKTGNTTLKIKLGNRVIKTMSLKVVGKNIKVGVKKATIVTDSSISLGEVKTAMGVFKDHSDKKIVNLPFNGTFILKTGYNSKVCIKKGNLKDIGNIYTKKCDEKDFVKDPEVTYKDTVGGLLIFDYKVLNSNSIDLKLVGKNSGKTYNTKNIFVSIPKGLTDKYNYSKETISMLEKGIVDGTKNRDFMEENGLSQKDALIWIENTLLEIKNKSTNPDTRAQISKKLIEITKDRDRNYTTITRKKFLEKSYKYLVINDNNVGISIEYSDLMSSDNKKANTIFDKENTWKDKFGDTHFQPNKKVTRGEGAYLLSKAMNKTEKLYLTLK